MAPRSRPAREVRPTAEREARPLWVPGCRLVRFPERCSPRSLPPHPGAAIAGKGLLRMRGGCPRPWGTGPVPGEAAGGARSDRRLESYGLFWIPACGILLRGTRAWRSRRGSPFRRWLSPSPTRIRTATVAAGTEARIAALRCRSRVIGGRRDLNRQRRPNRSAEYRGGGRRGIRICARKVYRPERRTACRGGRPWFSLPSAEAGLARGQIPGLR